MPVVAGADHLTGGLAAAARQPEAAAIGATLRPLHLTLVAIGCTPFDIAKSVSQGVGSVYPPAVLRLWTHTDTLAAATKLCTKHRISLKLP